MIVYRVVYIDGQYVSQKKTMFFFWRNIEESIEGYNLSPGFSTYLKASTYIRRWHANRYGTKKFRIER